MACLNVCRFSYRKIEEADGGDKTMTVTNQKIEGDIQVDDISTLDLTMKSGTSFTGAINPEGEEGEVHVIMENGATWTLTGNSYVDSFEGDTSSIETNGYHLYVLGEQII